MIEYGEPARIQEEANVDYINAFSFTLLGGPKRNDRNISFMTAGTQAHARIRPLQCNIGCAMFLFVYSYAVCGLDLIVLSRIRSGFGPVH